MLAIECLKAILYGIVEGVTEWLPVSSTGHLILFGAWIPFSFTKDPTLLKEFFEMFEVVIQLGAITAVLVAYWHRLVPWGGGCQTKDARATRRLWSKLLLAGLPAALIGVVGDALLLRLTGRDLDALLYRPLVVSLALVFYGICFLWLERHRGKEFCPVLSVGEEITAKRAFLIGCFQCLAILPGTSRSGATILGARLLGVSRPGATEFSFLLAVPVMLGAGAIKLTGFLSYLWGEGTPLPRIAWLLLALGVLVSYFISRATLRFFLAFVRRHSFVPFGIYRILLGIVVLASVFF